MPLAVIVNVAARLIGTVWLAGWVVMVGATDGGAVVLAGDPAPPQPVTRRAAEARIGPIRIEQNWIEPRWRL